MRLAYPRLGRTAAEHEIQRVREAFERGGVDAVEALVRFDHELKQPVATGRIATAGEIAEMRIQVIQDLDGWRGNGPLTAPEQRSAFDNALGVALHERLSILPSDAGHEETWSFLCTLVFPDLAAIRFPNLAAPRLLGTPRNALRRTWQRQELLGELMQESNVPLGEDELVGLFERTALIRNLPLVREVVRVVHLYEGPRRSEWARKLYKLVTFQTGARMLDLLSPSELRELVEHLAIQAVELSDEPQNPTGDDI